MNTQNDLKEFELTMMEHETQVNAMIYLILATCT